MQQNEVKVSITAQLSGQFKTAFQSADRQMSALGKTANDLNKKVGNIDAFRKQKQAVRDAEASWKSATANVAKLKREIAASGEATLKQQAELRRAVQAAKQASAAYNENRVSLHNMRQELQKSGVSVQNLGKYYRALKKDMQAANDKHKAAEQSLIRQQKLVAGMSSAWKGIGSAIAGATAGAAVLSQPMKQGMNWEERVMRLSDVAGAGKSPDQKRAIQKQLSDAITAAQKQGGGKRDDIAGGLDTLIGTGNMDPAQAAAMLPSIAQAAFASGTSADQVAAIALKAQQFGIKDTGSALDIVMRGGQAGGVEMKHMAQFLPEQMATARAAGYSGEAGLSQLVSMNQLALKTAGTPEQAANNVQNLLNKMIAPEFSKNVSDVTGKDWEKYSQKQREKGVYPVEAFAQLADESMSKDKKYMKLKKQLDAEKDPAKRSAMIGDMSSMMEGSQMGQFIQDRQALSAGLAMMYARKDIDPATGKSAAQTMLDTTSAANAAGTSASSAEFLRTGTFSKATDASEAMNRANEGTFNQLAGPMGSLLQSVTGLADKFPGFASAAYAATAALTALAAAGAGAGLYGMLTKGGGAAGAAAGGMGVLRAAGSKAPLIGAVAAGGIDAYGAYSDSTLTDAQKKAQYTGAAFGTAGAIGGAKLGAMGGAAIGAFGGPLAPLTVPAGALLGGVAGAAAGWYGGQAAGDFAGGKVFGEGDGDAAKAAAEAATAASQAATAAQNRPNLTMTTTNNLTVQAAPGAGAAELGAQINNVLQANQRKQDAEIRGRMMDKPGF